MVRAAPPRHRRLEADIVGTERRLTPRFPLKQVGRDGGDLDRILQCIVLDLTPGRGDRPRSHRPIGPFDEP